MTKTHKVEVEEPVDQLVEEPLEEELTDQSAEVMSGDALEPDYQDLYMRALAEAENARKRTLLEQEQFKKYAQLASALDLLPVVDNFYRATEHIPESEQSAAWVVGIMHIQKQLIGVLEGWGVSEIAAKVGDQFNPDQHEALGTVLNAELEEDQIVTIQNKGYSLNGRVLRPTQVIVSKINPN